jgi:hypothetical protein
MDFNQPVVHVLRLAEFDCGGAPALKIDDRGDMITF